MGESERKNITQLSKAEGKDDAEFKKKPDIGIELIEKSLKRGYRFFDWLTHNRDVFARYKASLGYVWG